MSEYSRALEIIKEVLEEKQAREVKVIDVKGKTSLADYFVICHASSNAHSKTLLESLIKKSKESEELKLLNSDTSGDQEWRVLDYGEVIVHLFLEDSRRFYDLDSIWSSANPVEALAKRADLREERKRTLDVRSIFSRARASSKRKLR